MIQDKRMVYLKSEDGLDFYEFKTRLFRYFYTDLAPYERTLSHTVRETLSYMRGGYHVLYALADDKAVGYCVITRGGGRNKFCTRGDAVIGSLWVDPKERGKKYGVKLIDATADLAARYYKDAYSFILSHNTPSIRSCLHKGFVEVGRVSAKGLLHTISNDENGDHVLLRIDFPASGAGNPDAQA